MKFVNYMKEEPYPFLFFGTASFFSIVLGWYLLFALSYFLMFISAMILFSGDRK